MRFASFLSGGFTAMTVINPPERKLAKRTSVQSTARNFTVSECFPNFDTGLIKYRIRQMRTK